MYFVSEGTNALNKYLEDNPALTAIIFIPLGLVLLGYGIYEVKSGTAQDKYGKQVPEKLQPVAAWGKLLGGIFCVGLGIYKICAG